MPLTTEAGRGRLAVARVDGASAVVAAEASAPLKLLTTTARGVAAWVYTGTLGAGLLPGDRIALDVEVGAGAALLLASQASTKVLPGGERPVEITLDARLAEGAVALVVPEPTVAFEGAVVRQAQRFALAKGASLVVVDAFSSGRAARGERWRFSSYRSVLEIAVGGEPIAREALALDDDGSSAIAERFGEIDAFTTAVVVGPAFADVTASLLEEVGRARVDARADPLASASTIAGGAVLRVAGRRVEDVAKFVRARLRGAAGRVGGDPWARRW